MVPGVVRNLAPAEIKLAEAPSPDSPLDILQAMVNQNKINIQMSDGHVAESGDIFNAVEESPDNAAEIVSAAGDTITDPGLIAVLKGFRLVPDTYGEGDA